MTAKKTANSGEGPYQLGVDFGRGDDKTCYTIMRGNEIIYSGPDIEQVKKHKYARLTIDAEDWVLFRDSRDFAVLSGETVA